MANYTILLIDYEPRSIERTRRPLIAAGYTVHVATDGLSGITAFSELQPDLVLIEAMIPKKHGFEVCQDLKKTPQGKRTPFVIMTSVYKGRKYRSQALHLYQCDDYVEKPIPEDQLLAVVRRFIGEAPVPAAGVVQSPPAEAPAPPRQEFDFEAMLSKDDDVGIEIEVIDTDAAETESEPEPPPPAPKPAAPRRAAPVSDEAEIEIMERLDAIIPGASSKSSPSHQASYAATATAAARRLDESIPDPFAVPNPDMPSVAEEIPASSEPAHDAGSSQVLPFDRAKRARKGKKSRGDKTSRAASPTPPAQATLGDMPPNPDTAARPAEAPEPRLPESVARPTDPRADLPEFPPAPEVESSSPSHAAARPGLPRWAWAVAAAAALYLIWALVLR